MGVNGAGDGIQGRDGLGPVPPQPKIQAMHPRAVEVGSQIFICAKQLWHFRQRAAILTVFPLPPKSVNLIFDVSWFYVPLRRRNGQVWSISQDAGEHISIAQNIVTLVRVG